MDFWNKLTKKASETYKGASEKTNKIAKETKLRLKISENKSKINDLYKEIGKKIYQKHVAEEDVNVREDIKEEIENIDNLAHEIEDYEKEIWSLKDSKQCPKCKSKIDKDATFCPTCGEKQPEPEVSEAKEVEVVEEKIDNVDNVATDDCTNAIEEEKNEDIVEKVVEEIVEEPVENQEKSEE